MTLVTLSSQNQITIPIQFLNDFQMRNGGKFLMGKKDDKIVLEPVKGSIIDELAGSLEEFILKNKRKIPVDEAIRRGNIAMAKHVASKI